VPAATAILAAPDRVELRLEGWSAEVDELAEAARAVTEDLFVLEDESFPARPVDDAPVVVEAAVPPSGSAALVEGLDGWTALVGVGLVWCRFPGSDDPGPRTIHDRATAAGGTTRVVRGRTDAWPAPGPLPAPDVHRRLKDAFDPAGILPPVPVT
jgi:FAD/FMN-containing dehydrogenase